MRVHIATDHAGLELSHFLIKELSAAGYDLIDHGPEEYDALDDYPSFCINAALAVKADRDAGRAAGPSLSRLHRRAGAARGR